jgi:hypothetical protein
MWKSILTLVWVILFLSCFSVGTAGTIEDDQAELWKNERFLNKAQAIKAGNWEKVSPMEVAMVGLYEISREGARIERRLESELERLYGFVWIGGLALTGYLVTQLVLTLFIVVRLGRKAS